MNRWLGRLLVFCAVVFTVGTLATQIMLVDLSNRTNNLAEQNQSDLDNGVKALEILTQATGPESQAESDARLAEAIKLLDCNHQRTVQRAVDELVAEGRREGGPSVMTPQCIQHFIENPHL